MRVGLHSEDVQGNEAAHFSFLRKVEARIQPTPLFKAREIILGGYDSYHYI